MAYKLCRVHRHGGNRCKTIVGAKLNNQSVLTAWPKIKRLMRARLFLPDYRRLCTNRTKIVDKDPELSMGIQRNFIGWTHDQTIYSKPKDSRLQDILGVLQVELFMTLHTVWTLLEAVNFAIKIEIDATGSPTTLWMPSLVPPTNVVDQQLNVRPIDAINQQTTKEH